MGYAVFRVAKSTLSMHIISWTENYGKTAVIIYPIVRPYVKNITSTANMGFIVHIK